MTSSPDPSASDRVPPGLIVALFGQMAFGLIAMTLCLPSLQEWPAIFGATQAQVQLTFSGYMLAFGLVQLAYGPLSDRYGRKPLLLTGLAVAAAGSLAAWVAPSLEFLIGARVLQGLGTGAGMVVGRAVVQDLFTGAQRTRMMAFVGMTMGLCPPVASLVGGYLHTHLGWRSNFALATALALLMLLAVWRQLPSRPRPALASEQPWWAQLPASYRRLLADRTFLLFAVMLAAGTTVAHSYFAGAPIVLREYGIGPDRMGWYIMAVPIPYMIGNALTTRLAHRLGDWRLMAAGHSMNVAGLVLMATLSLAGWNHPLTLALPMIIVGIGHGLMIPPMLSRAVSLLPGLAGSASALGGALQQAMGAMGAYAVGVVPHHGSLSLALVMLTPALCGLAALGVVGRGRYAGAPR